MVAASSLKEKPLVTAFCIAGERNGGGSQGGSHHVMHVQSRGR